MNRGVIMRTLASLFVCLATLSLAAEAQLTNPSFETNLGIPTGWNPVAGLTFVNPLPDAGFPTDGSRYLQVWTSNTGPATPHSNPGGFGLDAQNAAGIQQSFLIPAGNLTTMEFDCIFMSNDVNNDFLEVSLSDGLNTLNLVHLDTFSVGVGPASSSGLPTSLVTHVTVDIGASFPTASAQTMFTLSLWVGNRVDNTVISRGYFDNFTFAPGTPLLANTIQINDLGATQQLEIHTVNPSTLFFNLVSDNTSGPLGGGEAFGLYLSPLLFSILQTPAGTLGLHDFTNSSGDYYVNIPTFANPPGITFDFMLVTLTSTGGVDTITAPQRYVWP